MNFVSQRLKHMYVCCVSVQTQVPTHLPSRTRLFVTTHQAGARHPSTGPCPEDVTRKEGTEGQRTYHPRLRYSTGGQQTTLHFTENPPEGSFSENGSLFLSSTPYREEKEVGKLKMKQKGKEDMWDTLLKRETSDSFFPSLTSPFLYKQDFCTWGHLSVHSKRDNGPPHKMETASPKADSPFPKNLGPSCLSYCSIPFLLLGQRTWPVHPSVPSTRHQALQHTGGTDTRLLPRDGALVNTVLAFWATSFIFSRLHEMGSRAFKAPNPCYKRARHEAS